MSVHILILTEIKPFCFPGILIETEVRNMFYLRLCVWIVIETEVEKHLCPALCVLFLTECFLSVGCWVKQGWKKYRVPSCVPLIWLKRKFRNISSFAYLKLDWGSSCNMSLLDCVQSSAERWVEHMRNRGWKNNLLPYVWKIETEAGTIICFFACV